MNAKYIPSVLHSLKLLALLLLLSPMLNCGGSPTAICKTLADKDIKSRYAACENSPGFSVKYSFNQSLCELAINDKKCIQSDIDILNEFNTCLDALKTCVAAEHEQWAKDIFACIINANKVSPDCKKALEQ